MSVIEAEQFEENEQFDKAYEEYKKVLTQRPKSLDVLERLGHLAVMLDKKPEAEEYFTKMLELDMTNVMAHEQLMDIYFHTNKYKYYISRGNKNVVEQQLSHGINDYKKALDRAQTEQEANTTRFILGSLYEQTGKSHQAIDEYLRILDTANTNEVVYLNLAKIYVAEDATTSAIEILERARSNNYDTVEIKENLAQLYLKNNEPEKARGLTQDELVKVKSLLEEEKNAAAFEILDKIKGKNARNATFHSLLAQYYFNVKEFDKSLQSVGEFDKIQQNSPLTYQMRALIYEEKGDEFNSHLNWAKYNLSRKDKDVALNEYMMAYQLKEDDATLVKNIAELLEDLNDKHQAMEFYERLAKLEPNSRKALEKLAEFKESIGDYRSQTEILEKLYALDSRNAVVVKNLAKAYEKIKNKEKSLEYYNKFIAISPVNDEYEQIKTKINKLENTEMVEDEGLIGKIMSLFSKK